jgi:hypothetical protein
MVSSERPVLSVVVAIVSDTTESRAGASHLAECLKALTNQVNPPSMEVIIPYHQAVDGIERVLEKFSDMRFIPVTDLKSMTSLGGSREHHDELRARGLVVAKGDIIALIEDHARPDSNWCARIVEAHGDGYVAIGGAIENAIDRPLNWAVYYCDFGRYQNPLPPGESLFASDANASYKQAALEAIRSVWSDSFHETLVNAALISRGDRLALRPDIIVYQNRSNLRFGSALRERFIWGRSYAAARCQMVGGKRAIYAALSPLLPAVLMLRMAATARKKGRNMGKFLKALPIIAALLVSWSAGEVVGYLTARSA